MRRFTIDDWQQRLNKLNQPLFIIKSCKEGTKEIFTLQCYKCGNTFDADRKALYTACRLRERKSYKVEWCPICNKKRCVKGVNDVATLRKDLVKYFINKEDAEKYGIGNPSKVHLKCLECGNKKYQTVSSLCSYGFHCDYCSDNISLGNKIIRNMFLQFSVQEYKFEFTDSWTQNKRYDCYFSYNDKKYLIEIDGRQHIRDTNWATKESQMLNDTLKDELARENGYELIRIAAYESDFEYIKQNILSSKLADILDLDCIDWDVIHERTITGMNVEMANYYMKHKDLMLNEIASHFNVSEPTLRKALEKLARVGLCDYSKESAFKNAMKHSSEIKFGNKPSFTVYSPSGISLGTFKTVYGCFNTLEKEFKSIGLTLKQLDTQLYNGESYKGYSFIYECGLYEYHKNRHPVIFQISDLFNQGYSIKEIASKLNSSTSTVYKNVVAGANMGLCNYQRRMKRKGA